MTSKAQNSLFKALKLAAVKGDADGVYAAAAQIESNLIAPGHIDDITLGVIHCKKNSAGAMADFLRRPGVTEEVARLLSFPHRRPANMRIKVVSALYAAGAEPAIMKHLMQEPCGALRDHLSRLRSLGGSNHERLVVHKADPDLEAILSRPWNSNFHGSTHKDTIVKEIARRYPGFSRNFFLSLYFMFAALLVIGNIMHFTDPEASMLSVGHILSGLGVGVAVFAVNMVLDKI